MYINKLDSLDKNSLETQSLPKSKHEEIENLNRPITSKGIELEIQNLPTKKSPGPDRFTGKFHQRFYFISIKDFRIHGAEVSTPSKI